MKHSFDLVTAMRYLLVVTLLGSLFSSGLMIYRQSRELTIPSECRVVLDHTDNYGYRIVGLACNTESWAQRSHEVLGQHSEDVPEVFDYDVHPIPETPPLKVYPHSDSSGRERCPCNAK